VVVSPVEFHVMAQDESKFAPLTVRVCPEAPAVTDDGERLLIVGAGGLLDPALVKASTPFAVAVIVLPLPLAVMATLPSVEVSTL
jgi:hypothetical protein